MELPVLKLCTIPVGIQYSKGGPLHKNRTEQRAKAAYSRNSVFQGGTLAQKQDGTKSKNCLQCFFNGDRSKRRQLR